MWFGVGRCLPRAQGRRLEVARHLQIEARHARHLARLRHQTHPSDVEIPENLRADAVVAEIHFRGHRRLVGERAAAQLLRAFRAVQQYDDAATGFGNRGQGSGDGPGMRRAALVEQVHHRKRLVDAHQRFGVGRQRSADQHEVRRIGKLVAVDDQPERAVRRHQRPFGKPLDQAFGAAAVMDQVGDRADLETVRLREQHEIGQARHRAVFLHDLADHGGGRAAGQVRQIASGLGVPGARQHAAGLRHDRKHVPRLHDVSGLRVRSDRRQYRACAVGRRYAGGHALRRLD